jgi:hypothetical protein
LVLGSSAHRIRRRGGGRVQAEAAFFTVERFEAELAARAKKPMQRWPS